MATPPAAPPVTPPVAQGSTDVPYPKGASGDAAVSLDLTVTPDGTVSSAVVTEGAEPFAEQARRAVLEWRFTPARRGATPVASRIRARVQFHQEQEQPPSPTQPAARQGTKPAAPAATSAVVLEVPEEITVRGVRHETGETTLSAADVREMPGAFGDPFRAIEALPGVVPLVSGLPFFYIRGAPPTNNAYLVDGIKVPLLFHVGIGEGVIHPALIDRVDFYPGAAPASYGGHAGATIDGRTRDPPTTAHGEANVRLVDTGALVETPFADGRGTALAAGRYGYPGPILGAITPTIKLGYWDYQGRVTYRVGDKDTLGVFAFGSHDYLGSASTNNGQTGPVEEQLGSDFHRIDLRYDRALDQGRLRVAATLGYDSMGGAIANDGGSISTVTNLSAAGRVEVEKRLTPTALVRGGADVRIEHYGFTQGPPVTSPDGTTSPPIPSDANPPPTNLTWGGYADVVWRIAPRVELVPGGRVDVFESTRGTGPSGASQTATVPAFDPRLSARVTLTPEVAWLSTVGLSHQYPVLRVGGIPAFLVSVPGFPVGDSELQTAVQASQGVEVALPADFTLTTTGFLSGWSGLTDLDSDCVQIMPPTTPPGAGGPGPPQTPYTCPPNKPAHGVAYGAEVLLRRPLSKRLSGWLSYTLSRSLRDEYFITPTGGNAAATVPSDYDRTHVLNAVLAYDLGRRWRAGARFVFLSGTPYSNLSGNVPVPPYNDQRTAPFYRVDVRLEKRWALGKHGYIAFIAEVQNVTLSKEQSSLGLSCVGNQTSPTGPSTTQCTPSTVGPLDDPQRGGRGFFLTGHEGNCSVERILVRALA